MREPGEKLPLRFGSFYLYDIIGQGGMAEIYLAKAFTGLGTERQTVIKRILPHLTSKSGFGEMLIKEAKLCSRLSHANVVQTYNLGQIEGQYYIAMEYVEGFDVNRLLGMLSREKLALPLEFALYIITETLRGLDYAHRLTDEDGTPLAIIHRDVSPTNVLISIEGNVKVCDFGIAKVAFGDLGLDTLDKYHLKGKVAYMAPECLNEEAVVDYRADLYASGILLWELLMGRRLFKRKNEEETLALAKAAEIPELQNRGFPEFELLSSLVSRALSRNPDERFQTGKEFIRALEDYMYASGLMISQLKFSEFLMDNFGQRLLEQRLERNRRLEELEEYQEEVGNLSADDEDGIRPSIPVDLSSVKPPPPAQKAPQVVRQAFQSRKKQVAIAVGASALTLAAAAAVAHYFGAF